MSRGVPAEIAVLSGPPSSWLPGSVASGSLSSGAVVLCVLVMAQRVDGELLRWITGQQTEGGVEIVGGAEGNCTVMTVNPPTPPTDPGHQGTATGEGRAIGGQAAGALVVRPLEPAAADEGTLAAELASLINDVYLAAENGLWRPGATRTTASQVAELIRAGQIVVASLGGEVVGSVRVHDVAGDASEFGMLVAAPAHRGTGVGRALLDFVERRGRERGLRAVRLELLVPRTWSHPGKEFLTAWYGRRGYQIVRTERLDGPYPHLAPLLATPCDLQIREKPLRRTGMPHAEPDDG